MATSPTRKEELDLRLTAIAKQALHAAAGATQHSVNEFVLDSALGRAEETLAVRRYFRLSAEKWEAFLPRVEKLLHTLSVFDQRDPSK